MKKAAKQRTAPKLDFESFVRAALQTGKAPTGKKPPKARRKKRRKS